MSFISNQTTKIFSIILLLSPMALGAACAKSNDSAGMSMSQTDLSPAQANELIKNDKNIVILDVRTPEEFAQGHVTNAINMDYQGQNFATQVQSLPRDKTYVVYCRSGRRSAQSMQVFSNFGINNVKNVKGGISAWQGAGLP